MSPNFRINAKNFFLTYPQCTVSKENALQQLLLLRPSWAVVASEQHADGHPHLHALLGYTSKYDCRRETHFDIGNFHGNYQAARNLKATLAYVQKGGDYISFGVPPASKSWGEISATLTKEDFLQAVRENYPRDWILCNDRVLSYAERVYGQPAVYQSTYFDFVIPELIKDWCNMYLTYPCLERPRTLILIGPSRLGKTEWARSLGTHMYFNHLFNMDDWNADAKYVVFDDFKWDFIPSKKCFLGAQKCFVITDKYRKKHTVRWGKPCIVLTNDDPTLTEWESANCLKVFINTTMF